MLALLDDLLFNRNQVLILLGERVISLKISFLVFFVEDSQFYTSRLDS